MTGRGDSSLSDPKEQKKGVPVATESTTQSSRPTSPLSGGSDNGSERPIREKLKKASIGGLSTHGEKEEKTKADIVSADSSAGEEENGPEDSMLTDTSPPSRGRPPRKRSFDDLQNESVTGMDETIHDDATRAGGHHKRMRSREMTFTKMASVNGRAGKEQTEPLPEEEHDAAAQKSPGGAGIMVAVPVMDDGVLAPGEQSPKKKRSRDQFDQDHAAESDAPDKEDDQAALSDGEASETENELSRNTSNGDKGEPVKKRHRDASQESKKTMDVKSVDETVRIYCPDLGS
jgi:Ran-binding protein 3